MKLNPINEREREGERETAHAAFKFHFSVIFERFPSFILFIVIYFQLAGFRMFLCK